MGYEIVFVLPLLLAALASMVMCAVCIIAQRNGAGDKIEAAFVICKECVCYRRRAFQRLISVDFDSAGKPCEQILKGSLRK